MQAPTAAIRSVFLPIHIYIVVVSTNMILLCSSLFFTLSSPSTFASQAETQEDLYIL